MQDQWKRALAWPEGDVAHIVLGPKCIELDLRLPKRLPERDLIPREAVVAVDIDPGLEQVVHTFTFSVQQYATVYLWKRLRQIKLVLAQPFGN